MLCSELLADQTRMRIHIKRADIKCYFFFFLKDLFPAFQKSSRDVPQKDFYFHKSKNVESHASYCAHQENTVNDHWRRHSWWYSFVCLLACLF